MLKVKDLDLDSTMLDLYATKLQSEGRVMGLRKFNHLSIKEFLLLPNSKLRYYFGEQSISIFSRFFEKRGLHLSMTQDELDKVCKSAHEYKLSTFTEGFYEA